jgi:predicted AlkP superfamily phosphohydrolase/phosphomutase/tetratricopeptide (TPR) repeat protein
MRSLVVSKSKPRVLLVGWDAADWEHISPLIDRGLLPTLASLVSGGTMGNLSTLQPVISPMLWNSIATGKQPYKHGIYGFVEPDPHHGGSRPYSSCSRKVKALWNILSQNGFRCNVVNWWASHPAEKINGCVVTNAFAGVRHDPAGGWTIASGTIHPQEKALVYAPNKVFAEELGPEQVLPFVPDAAKVNQDDDNRLSTLLTTLSDTLTTHAVGTAVLENEPWDFAAVYYTAIDHFAHGFMYYHPPRLPWVPEADYEMYKHVMTAAYRFSDMALKRLLDIAGAGTTVILCSDHGFQSREHRPMRIPNEPAGPAYWHRRYGVFLAHGPNIKSDERIFGGTLLDITPTILAIFGLPVALDMDGRVLGEIFVVPPPIQPIGSWEDVPGDSGMHSDDTAASAEESEELMRQFVALGYIDPPSENKEEQRLFADTECKYNLARNLAWCDRNAEAVEIFHELVHRFPWESRFILQLAKCALGAGYIDLAERTLISGYDPATTRFPAVRLLWVDVLVARGRLEEAYHACQALEAMSQRIPEHYTHVGNNYLRLRKWADADRAFRRAIEAHPDSAEAHVGLSTVALRLGDNQLAADSALAAAGLTYFLPRAHLNLGIALARSGDGEAAIRALELALRFNPGMRNAHRMLAYVHGTLLRDAPRAMYHRQQYARLSGVLAQPRHGPSQAVAGEFDLPEFPSEEQRERIIAEKRPPSVDLVRKSGRCFVLVSGLPRSGTSLMMQMLAAGGLPSKTDGERAADIDNPEGYYEWEAIKRVGRKPQIMDEQGLERKAIKVVSMLLPQMPYQHEYKIIFMTRPIAEVVESQAAMIQRLNTEGANINPSELMRGLTEHRDSALEWLAHHPRAKFIEIEYPGLISNPDEPIQRIASFLGRELLPHPERMRAAIRPGLYRKRKA